MQNIIGKVRFDAQTKITNGNFVYDNYSRNPEYIQMLEAGNFIDVTEEQYQFIRSNNDNGIDVCVIDGQLVEYSEDLNTKLANLKIAKKQKFEKLFKEYYSNLEVCRMKITFNGRTDYLESKNNAHRGFLDLEYLP